MAYFGTRFMVCVFMVVKLVCIGLVPKNIVFWVIDGFIGREQEESQNRGYEKSSLSQSVP